MKNSPNEKIVSAAKILRKNMTDAELKLWYRLRGKQLGVKFRKQHPFENFILDFACLEAQLVIEVDGSQHVENKQYDELRTKHLQHAGFTVLRFWNNEVLLEIDAVIAVIWEFLQRRNTPSPTQPPP